MEMNAEKKSATHERRNSEVEDFAIILRFARDLHWSG